MTQSSAQNRHRDTGALRIISYHPSYRDSVIALFIAGSRSHEVGASNEFRLDIERSLGLYVQQFDDMDALVATKNGGCYFLAVTPDDGALVAMIGVKRSDEDVAGQAVELLRLIVDAAWQRCGVGSMLMKHAMQYATDRFQVRRFYLEGYDSPSAVALYTKCGFLMEMRDYRDRGYLSPYPFFWRDLQSEKDGSESVSWPPGDSYER